MERNRLSLPFGQTVFFYFIYIFFPVLSCLVNHVTIAHRELKTLERLAASLPNNKRLIWPNFSFHSTRGLLYRIAFYQPRFVTIDFTHCGYKSQVYTKARALHSSPSCLVSLLRYFDVRSSSILIIDYTAKSHPFFNAYAIVQTKRQNKSSCTRLVDKPN